MATIAGCSSQANFSGSTRTGARILAPTEHAGDTIVTIDGPATAPITPGGGLVFDPKTSSYKLTVETSTAKPVTNLYLIIDNSFSMSVIQAKVAVATEKLMRQVEAENLNVNLLLFTTTDVSSGYAPNVSFLDGSVQRSIGLPYLSSGMDGAKGNTNYRNRTYFELTPDGKKSLAGPAARSGDSFWVSDEVVMNKSQFGTPDGILKLREAMTAADLKTQIDLAVATIGSLGTNGSDKEQPIAALYSYQVRC